METANLAVSGSLFRNAVEFGKDVEVKIVAMEPNRTSPKLDRLDCGVLQEGDKRFMIILAQYDKMEMKFKPPAHGIPSKYSGRVKHFGTKSFVYQRITFDDVNTTFSCILNYVDGNTTSHTWSNEYKINAVYGEFKLEIEIVHYYCYRYSRHCYCIQRAKILFRIGVTVAKEM